ncbi:hemicentin-1-like isoform X2 [Mya arenaria]|nr:hemicentin-1-like isoform X2 [Mya arenaria]
MEPSIGPTVKGYANTTFDMHVQCHQRQIITTAFDSDTNLTCEVYNILYPTGANSIKTAVDSSLQIKVLYPPDIPVLRMNSTCMNNSTLEQAYLRLLEFDHVKVECVTEGNPEPNCQWTNHSQSCTLDILNASKEDTGTYVCLAFNTMKTTQGRIVAGRNVSSFYLDILYPPKIRDLTKRVEVLEGVTLRLICDAEPGNPNDTFFAWESKRKPERNTFDQNLKIPNISRTEEGEFTCYANNIMHPTGGQELKGSDIESVYVDVQYKAFIITFTALHTTVYQDDNLSFACDVDSDPPASITILSPTGSALKYIEGNNQLLYNKTSSCLEDVGQFTCISANKHNQMQPEKRNVTVDVQCSPRYPADYNKFTTIGTRPGEIAVHNFSVFSNPPPTNFTWTNLSNSMQISLYTASSDRVIIITTDMSSALIITSVEPWDSGNYSVRVENEIGSMNETFRIVVNIYAEPAGETSTSHNVYSSNNSSSGVVGGTVGAVCTVILVVVLLAVFLYRKRRSCNESDRCRDGGSLKDDTRYEDLALGHRGISPEYSHLDFRDRTENSLMQTPFKDNNAYENLKLNQQKLT